ncbi:glycerophosphodiester phosphodiesterase [Humibacter soli]
MSDQAAFFDGEPPRVIAHRGLASDAPENTIPAFRAALDAGADIIETDVHASSDGVAVICHDDDLARIAGDPRAVEQLTLAELKALDLTGGGRLATLSEALAELPDARFNIDVKTAAAIEPTARAIRDAGAESRVLVTAFDQRRRRAVVKAIGGVATSASTPGVVVAMLGTWLRLGPLVRLGLRDVDAVQVPPRSGRITVVSPAFVRAVHTAGREVHVWTINDVDQMRELLALGVDGVISDRCDLLFDVVNRSRSAGAIGKIT